jgi:hypothetical protein
MSTFEYRKKPVVIEAYQHFTEEPGHTKAYPKWLFDALTDGTLYEDADGLHIKTLEGPLHVSHEDWIIRGVKGELYPCKPDIFAATYDKV